MNRNKPFQFPPDLPIMNTRFTLLFPALLAAMPFLAQPGALDPTFGTGGYVVDPTLSPAVSVAVYPDGRIVASSGPSLYMYMPDGTLAAGFGTGGVLASLGISAGKVLIQPDGRILAGGLINAGGVDIAVARYAEDGTPDASFGTDGIAQVALPNFDYFNGMTLLDDGRVLVTGTWNIADSPALLVMLNPDGTPDDTFGTSGQVQWVPEAGDDFKAYDAAVQQDGAIVFSGFHSAQADDDFVARFTPTGAVDNTYNGTGMLYLDFGPNNDEVVQVELDAQGRAILLATASSASSFHSGSLARVNTDGTLDLTFGTDGILPLNSATSTYVPTSFIVQADGKLVVTGATMGGTSAARELFVSRYTADGVLDPDFGDAGYSILALPEKESGLAIAATSEGKLVVAGQSHITGEVPDLLLARFWQDSGVLVPGMPQQSDLLTVLPCPVTTSFTIASSVPFTPTTKLEILDMTGRQLMLPYWYMPEGFLVDAASLPAGMYIARVHSHEGSRSARFQKH